MTTEYSPSFRYSCNDYIYGPNGQVVEQVSESTNAADYYVTDQLGSMRGLTTRLAMSEAGAEATVVAGWMAEVQGERLRAEADLVAATPREPMSDLVAATPANR